MPVPRSKAAKGNRTRQLRAQMQKKAADRLTAAWEGLKAMAQKYDAEPVLAFLDANPEEVPEYHKRMMDGFVQHNMNALVEQQLKKEEMDKLSNALNALKAPPQEKSPHEGGAEGGATAQEQEEEGETSAEGAAQEKHSVESIQRGLENILDAHKK